MYLSAADLAYRRGLVGSLVLLLALAGCSRDSGSTPRHSPAVVTLTEKDGVVSASSDLVKARTGQQIVLEVRSDAADEIDVHTVPEHEFHVIPGSAQKFTFSVTTPGTAEVESHGLDQLILKLEIS